MKDLQSKTYFVNGFNSAWFFSPLQKYTWTSEKKMCELIQMP